MFQLKSLFVFTMVASLTACSSLPDREDRLGDSDSDPEVMEDSAPGIEPGQSGVQVLPLDQSQLPRGYNASHMTENLRVTEQQEVVAFEPVVYFNLDQYELDDKSIEVVKHFSHRMLESTQLKVKIKGHTDERGTPEYNLALGEKRGKSVAEAMMLFGIEESRIEVISYGEMQPVNSDSNEAAWQENRRAEFRIY